MSPRFDLVVRNGTLVIPGVGTVAADVGVCGSCIAAIGDELSGSAQEVLDAGGKVVLPGIFDPHVHIGNELSFEHEAQSETRAAILGGVTTIGIMLRSLEDSYFLHLPAFRRAMDETSYVDSVFHLQIFTEQQIAEMPDYARQYGVRSFKFYMSGIPGIVPYVNNGTLLHGLRAVAALGPHAIAAVHCEDGALIDAAREEGIRITLIDACYLRGGLDGRPLEAEQLSFSDGDADGWARRMDELKEADGVRIGAAIHSVRAVDPESMRIVATWAREHGAPLHVHLAEQPAEVEECLRVERCTPAELLEREGILGPGLTAVHAIHVNQHDISLLGENEVSVCSCTTTERDLGDRVGPLTALADAGCALTVGSDSFRSPRWFFPNCPVA